MQKEYDEMTKIEIHSEEMESKKLSLKCLAYLSVKQGSFNPLCNPYPNPPMNQKKTYKELFNHYLTRENLTIKNFDALEEKNWQKQISDLLDTQTDRQIIWIVDKTTFNGQCIIRNYLDG